VITSGNAAAPRRPVERRDPERRRDQRRTALEQRREHDREQVEHRDLGERDVVERGDPDGGDRGDRPRVRPGGGALGAARLPGGGIGGKGGGGREWLIGLRRRTAIAHRPGAVIALRHASL
jgi:hypothetical protein